MQTDPNSSLLMKTLRGEFTDRPPFWFMRQAGRVLPSYRKIKENNTLWEMMNDPETGAEVTLLPVGDLGVDAAILFSDILMVPYAMGMDLEFAATGPRFASPLAESSNPMAELDPDPSRLQFVYDIIERVIQLKPAHIPLIGFCGAPLTVMCYMIQGLGKKADFPEAIKFLYREKKLAVKIIEMVTELSVEYIRGQIRHGIDVFQLFDTHAGLVPAELYDELFMPSIRRMGRELRDNNIPFIFFPKGTGTAIGAITPDTCDFLSVDWQTPITLARRLVHREVGLQGNLDPRLLYADQDEIRSTLEKYIPFGRNNGNWIFNLGHGFIKDLPYENAKFVADWLRETDWERGTDNGQKTD